MSAVDVLHVLDKCHSALECGGLRHVLSEARAAVAELIEATKYAEAFISISVPSLARDRDEAINEVLPNLRAALAACKGETP